MNTPPDTLEAARALAEISPGTPYLVDWTLPIYWFLGEDNRLMKVVQVIDYSAFFKTEVQPNELSITL